MEFEISFTHSSDFVYIKTAGNASVKGFDELLSSVVNSPNWKTGTKQLIDHRKINSELLTSADIRKIKDIVERYAGKLGNGRCAFVVSEAAAFGLVRMYELLGGVDLHQEVAVFYTIEEAEEWLQD